MVYHNRSKNKAPMAETTFFFHLILVMLVFSLANAQSPRSNITKGSIVYANSIHNFWLSPSGHFAFGFYHSGNGYRVGIWLVGTPKNTIVWTARRTDPEVSASARLAFVEDGSLLLRNSTEQIPQVIAETTARASLASMLDTGNFVLYDSNFDIVWSSFSYPTNTLLVGQKLQNYTLNSSESETDDSVGSFKLRMQFGNGNLNAYPINSLQEPRYVYWTSNTANKGNLSLNLASNGQLYLQNSTGNVVKNLYEGEFQVNESTFLYRATFDVDGILRLYQHQIGATGSLSSKILWATINEEDRCSVKGICGLNSYCNFNGTDISCLCPPGFDYIDPEQRDKGCKLNSLIVNDCLNKTEGYNFIISPLQNVVWERNEYDVLTGITEEACSEACLKDCNCVVATFKEQICYKQSLPLRYGQKNASNYVTSFVKSNNDSSPADPPTSLFIISNKLGKKLLAVSIALIAFSLIVFLSSGYLIYTHQAWSYKISSRQATPSDVIEEINLRSFSYRQLIVATNDFSEELGRGASGRVYKGCLVGKEIAVKRLERMVEEGESVFRNEMKIIGRTHHKNLVRLIGFCSEGSNRLLVYEFMKNGSLGKLLFGNDNRLNWRERVRIALEIAKGLHYLHEECPTRIIHCDVKPHNILMDESWTAKISDFGLSKLLKPDQTRTYTTPRGTRGYGAPEWFRNNTPITVKADVYSFGILLLEIISCRKNMDLEAREEEILLTTWVYDCYEAGELKKVVGEEDVNLEELEKMVKIGLCCVQIDQAMRPSMKSVVLMIEGNIATTIPPPIYATNS